MMPSSLPSFEKLESMIVHIDPTAIDFRITMSGIRHSINASCDGGAITFHQSRTLLETISLLRSELTVRYKGDVSKAVRPEDRIDGHLISFKFEKGGVGKETL